MKGIAVNEQINQHGINRLMKDLQKEFGKHRLVVPVEAESDDMSSFARANIVNNYNTGSGPVFNQSNVNHSQFASGNRHVAQEMGSDASTSPELQQFIDKISKIIEELDENGIQGETRAEADEAASEALTEATKDEPDNTLVRRAVNTLKGALLSVANGLTTGAAAGSQAWAQKAISDLSVPF